MIDYEDSFRVTIEGAFTYSAQSKDGKPMMVFVLPGKTESGEELEAKLFAHNGLVANGKNAGKKLYEVTLKNLQDLGMEGDTPDFISTLDGKEAEFVTRQNEYNGNVTYPVAFVNPVSAKLGDEEAVDFWSQITGEKKSSTKPKTEKKTEAPKEKTREEKTDEARAKVSSEAELVDDFPKDEDIPF